MNSIIEQEQGFAPDELRKIRALKSARGVQRYLDSLPYHFAGTAWSPRFVLRHDTAHCLEGAIFGAAALEVLGYKPLIVDLEAVRDTDHVLALFREGNHWGSIAKSNFSGLRYRAPIYRSIRELALSYFEDYFNLKGERTLRRFSAPVNLSRFDSLHWRITEKPVWFIAEYLTKIRHYPLMKSSVVRRLHPVDERALRAGLVGYAKHA